MSEALEVERGFSPDNHRTCVEDRLQGYDGLLPTQLATGRRYTPRVGWSSQPAATYWLRRLVE